MQPLLEADYQDILASGVDMLHCSNDSDFRCCAIEHCRRLYPASTVLAASVRDARTGRLMEAAQVDSWGRSGDYPELQSRYWRADPGLPYLARAWAQGRSTVLTSNTLMNDPRVARGWYYRKLLEPRAMHHALALALVAAGRPQALVAVYRSREAGPFEAADVARAQALLPFLTAALAQLDSARQTRERDWVIESVRGDSACQGLAVLDEGLTLVYRDSGCPAALPDWFDAPAPASGDGAALRRLCRRLIGCAPGTTAAVTLRGPQAGAHEAGVVEVRCARNGSATRLVLRFAPGGAQAGPAGAFDTRAFTARERDVAACVLEGLANAEIGARLGLSPRTVGNHLAAVYRKAGVDSRAALAAHLTPPSAPTNRADGLTAREREILAALAQGSSNKKIAARFELSAATVARHVCSIYAKLGVRNRAMLIRHLRG